jgi:hypothetical protein
MIPIVKTSELIHVPSTYTFYSYISVGLISLQKNVFFFLGSKHSKHVIRTFEKSCFNYQELKMALKSRQWKHG